MPKKKTTKAPASETLLVELLTEELPPKSLRALSEVFGAVVLGDLTKGKFLTKGAVARTFATPRRITVQIERVCGRSPDEHEDKKGPTKKDAYDASGNPTEKLLGFLRKYGASLESVRYEQLAKGEVVVISVPVSGRTLDEVLSKMVESALKTLPIPKTMRWGSGEAQFVRPVHGLVMLHGSRVVPGVVLGLESSNRTLGHRFLSGGPITVKDANGYATVLRDKGTVEVAFARRREQIIEALGRAAGKGVELVAGDALLDEITALVESPAVYAAEFSAEFLAVPEECLILSMQQHQRYVPLRDKATGKLLPRFLFVSNIAASNPREIVRGNERVLRARLADAKFFYDQDRKTKLADRVPRLANVIYHNKLGSQLDRVERIKKLSGTIARELKADVSSAERAAWLSKADLLTEMVGEFPELQGVMGRYYAQHDGEPKEIADAIEQHYRPRFAGDELPKGKTAVTVALADKLDALAGLFGIGQTPTGDKDPLGLRRAALGVIRILIERDLPLSSHELINASFASYNGRVGDAHTDLQMFILDRLSGFLRDQGYSTLEVDSVVSLHPDQINLVPRQLEAVRAFNKLPEAESLAAANKRVVNILKQAANKGESFANAEIDRLKEPAERALFEALKTASQRAAPLFKQGDYAGYLKTFSVLKSPVDAFFDSVMVMVEDRELRQNRLALLADLREQMNRVADISKLAA